ncbi:type VI secretion system protein TssA [Pseudomonas sp. 18175]|uniref:type VI secretion system protein TssA n=1 Tax=Pseudomonas sp. 18175 TaxID=3390056 RepID=UPI003D22DF4B
MVYSDKLYDYYLELASQPCSPTNFAGSDMRFSSEYEFVESELGKAHSIHGAAQPDWQKIIDTSERLLCQHSKDLRVAVWLTWALHQRESFAGLLAGLGLLCRLCEHHWSVVYPEKRRTRGAAFDWLVMRLEPLFAHSLSLQEQRPLFQALLDHLVRLDALWAQQLGDDAPLLLPTRRQLAQRLEHVPPEAPPAVAVIAQVKQATAQLIKPETVLSNEKDAQKLLRALQEQARPLSVWWLRQSATDLRALRLNRTLAWLALVNYPHADGERVTTLRAPAPEKLKHCRERFAQGHYADLILELEASLTGAMFWFDGLHMVWRCLQALHADQAMTELEVTFALLLQRFPNLPQFRFLDGTVFADDATLDWIAQQVTPHLQAPEANPLVIDTNAAPWEIAFSDAASRLHRDGLKAAVQILKQGMCAAQGERARFHWRLAQARLCVQAGKHELAKVQLEHLDAQLHRAGLERWEPELGLQVIQLLHRCYDLLPQSHVVRERKEDTHRRLCIFDLEAVLE